MSSGCYDVLPPSGPDPRVRKRRLRVLLIFGLFGCCVLVGKACDQNQRPMEGEVEFKQLWARLGMKRKLRSAPLTLTAKPNLLATCDIRHSWIFSRIGIYFDFTCHACESAGELAAIWLIRL